MPRNIVIQLKGSADDGGDVRLSDFIEQLKTISDALRETERLVHGIVESKLYYRVADLSHNSPSKVTLEAFPAEADVSDSYIDEVVEAFSENLNMIDVGGVITARVDMAAMQSYLAISRPLNRHLSELSIEVGEKHFNFDKTYRSKVDSIIGPDELSYDCISGRMEAINLHGDCTFAIYPVVGPRKISGRFSRKKRKEFREGIDQFVTVFGTLRFKGWDVHPYAIKADEIEIHPPNDALPDLLELRGIATGITGDLTTGDYLQKMRSGW